MIKFAGFGGQVTIIVAVLANLDSIALSHGNT
jgi:hypothetical protein